MKIRIKLPRLERPDEDKPVVFDETLIIHDNGTQLWLVVAIDITNKHIRLDVITNRTFENLKIFVLNHIIPNYTHDRFLGNFFG